MPYTFIFYREFVTPSLALIAIRFVAIPFVAIPSVGTEKSTIYETNTGNSFTNLAEIRNWRFIFIKFY